MPLPSGTRLGTYEIVAPLGAGGMGEVYRARDLRLGRQVALKVLPEAMARDADRLARFEREARMVAGLNHPNIVTLFSVEDEGDLHFLIMELVEGQSLANLVTAGGLPLARVVEIGIALADALSAAHEKGVVHRDLKPANVMVARDGRVKVLDFGLAKLRPSVDGDLSRASTEADDVSEVGNVAGTVPYMAPEQVRGESVDARSDVFALGITLYELAAGQRPFTGASSADISSAILRDPPPPLARVRSDLPGDLERIVGRCLEKNPRHRFQTALDVSNELRSVRRALERGAGSGRDSESDKVASIAVLPFVNRSASIDDEYFSDGLADELLNVLAKIRGLRVAARTSAFHFKGKDTTIAEVGRTLNVATVLEGSVRKAGPRVRISVQLVKVSDGYHLWSETYDRTVEDIFAVQDDIAQSVVKELRTTLLGENVDSDASGKVRAEVSKAARGRGTDPEAHRLYLLAGHLLDRATREDIAKAIQYAGEAVKLDPDFALAWDLLSRGHSRQADLGYVAAEEGYRHAREAVERALAVEPDLAEGHAEMGWIHMTYRSDWRAAQASFARALELAPRNAMVLRRAGQLSAALGRIEEAIAMARQALEQDPLSSATYSSLGSMLLYGDHFQEAEAAFRQALDLAPDRAGIRAVLATLLVSRGRGEEALEEASRERHREYGLWALAIVHHEMRRDAESDAALQELEKFAEFGAFQIAEVYAVRGDLDAAFSWLERAHVQRDAGLMTLAYSLRLRPLHGDPRWRAFMKKRGLVA